MHTCVHVHPNVVIVTAIITVTIIAIIAVIISIAIINLPNASCHESRDVTMANLKRFGQPCFHT